MGETAWQAVTLCLQRDILNGFVNLHHDERLLDLLNSVSINWLESRRRFLALSNVIVKHTDGTEERMPAAYINKVAVHLAVMWHSDLGRGIGAKAGKRPYPFVEKLPVPVSVRLQLFSLMGRMHCASGQNPWHVLEEQLMFLPLTNVEVRPLSDDSWSDVPFVAVNREQILSLQEEETPLLQVQSSQPEPLG